MQTMINLSVLQKRRSCDVGGWNTRMVRTLWIQITYDYVNTTSTKGTDNLHLHPSAGVKQESEGKTGLVFVPQILHVPSVLQNRYDGVINPIYCE